MHYDNENLVVFSFLNILFMQNIINFFLFHYWVQYEK